MNRRQRWRRGGGWLALELGLLPGIEAAELGTNPPPGPGAPPPPAWGAAAWWRTEVLGIPLWEYFAFLLYLIVAFYLAKLVGHMLVAALRKQARRTGTLWEELVPGRSHGPVRVLTFIILLYLGLRIFAWPKWSIVFIALGLRLIIACALTYVAIRLVDLLTGLWQQRAAAAEQGRLDPHLFPLIRNSLKVVVLVVAVVVTAQNLGMEVSALLASLSIGGLALGLAAQDTLANLFGSVAIFADKPFGVGDHIQLDDIEGTVETIGLRSTRVRNPEGFLVSIPNQTMAKANIFNLSKRPGIRTVLDLRVTWDTPAPKLERAVALINSIYRAHPKTADLLISLNTFDSASMNLRVIHWWDSTNLREYLLGFQELNLELKRRLEAEGISFGSPSQTVHLR